jgi:predicted nucleic acid-binding protein
VTGYVVDSMALLRHLVGGLPEGAGEVFDRAEAGIDVLYAPGVVVGETLYQVAFGGVIAGVEVQADPGEVYRRTVTNGPVEVAPLDEEAMAVYASVVEFYEAELHDAMVHATHRSLGTEAVVSDDPHLRENGVELVW